MSFPAGDVHVQIFEPEFPITAVQIPEAERQVVLELDTGSPVRSVFGRIGDVTAECSDYAACYAPIGVSGLPAGGLINQVLTKLSAADFDAGWVDPDINAKSFYSEMWHWTTKTGDANLFGEIGLNAGTWSASILNINEHTDDGRDMTPAFGILFVEGNQLYVQHKTDPTRFGRFGILASGTDHGTWRSFPVVLLESSGLVPEDNVDTVVTVMVIGVGARGLPVGGTDGQVLTKVGSSDFDADWETLPAGVDTFLGLLDAPDSYSGQGNKVVSVNSGETGLEFISPATVVSTFLGLTDTPDSYTGQAAKLVVVNGAETGLEFVTPPTGVTPANPTAQVELTAVNGSAPTFMRSDAAPALDQGISPVWTGTHDFTGAVSAIIRTPVTGLEIVNKDYVDNSTPNFGGTRLLTGGGVAWTGTGLNFIVSAATYLINGTQYSSPQTSLTLAAADPTNDRIDVFAVTTSGTAVVVTGTPGGPPLEPQVDPGTQLRLTSVYITAGATTPPLITNENIYLENTEWTTSTNAPARINLASTSNPFAGTKDIEATNSVSTDTISIVKPASGTVNLSNFTSLILQVRVKNWPSAKTLVIYFSGPSILQTSLAMLKNGAFGLNTGNTTSYQQIVIPVSAFNSGSSLLNTLHMNLTGGGAAVGYYIDNIILQSGGSGGGTGGGDFSTNTSVSVVGEPVLFADTTGKLGKRATGTGIATLTSGVLSTTTPAALTKTDDTNVTLTLGGTPTTALLAATSLTLGWSGTLAVARGGTGAATAGAHNYFGNNTGLSGAPGFHQIDYSELTGTPTVPTDISGAHFVTTQSESGLSAEFSLGSLTSGLLYHSVSAGVSTPATVTLGSDLAFSAPTLSAAHTLTLVADGSGSVLSSGTKNPVKIAYGGTLQGWTLIGSPSGSITVDILRATDTNGLPVTSIVGGGGTKPALSSAVENSSTSFSGWTSTVLNAKDNIAISLSGITNCTYVALTLYFK